MHTHARIRARTQWRRNTSFLLISPLTLPVSERDITRRGTGETIRTPLNHRNLSLICLLPPPRAKNNPELSCATTFFSHSFTMARSLFCSLFSNVFAVHWLRVHSLGQCPEPDLPATTHQWFRLCTQVRSLESHKSVVRSGRLQKGRKFLCSKTFSCISLISLAIIITFFPFQPVFFPKIAYRYGTHAYYMISMVEKWIMVGTIDWHIYFYFENLSLPNPV